MPIISAMLGNGIAPGASALLGTLLIAGTGLCILLDRFGGFTSGWVRYVKAWLEIERLKQSFQFQWEELSLRPLADGEDKVTRAQVLLQLASLANANLWQTVSSETAAWAQEFTATLGHLETEIKHLNRAPRTPDPTSLEDGVSVSSQPYTREDATQRPR